MFELAWGERINCSDQYYETNYKRIAVSIAAWQASSEVNSFSSKRDIALANDTDGLFPLDGFTDQENLGHDIFYGKGTCAAFCHSNSFRGDGTDPEELYTADGYFNIGTPANGEIPDATRDFGLYEHVAQAGFEGLFRTPTMRNVDKRPHKFFTKAYAHNGWFKSLGRIVHFYNTRDMKPQCPVPYTTGKDALAQGCWPEADVPELEFGTVFQCGPSDEGIESCKVGDGTEATFATYCDNPDNSRDIGNLCLTAEEEAAVVVYLNTLNDTVTAQPPRPYKPTRHKMRKQQIIARAKLLIGKIVAELRENPR